MHILTGGAGFIGSNMLAELNRQGIDDILIVDNLGSGEKWKNLVGKRFTDYLHKDRFANMLRENRGLPSQVTAVIHLGACSSTTETNADYMLANNTAYSKLLASWALKQNARFIYASSAATYGSGDGGFSDSLEDLDSLEPLNVYALSKQLFDQWVVKSKILDKVVGLKFFNVYGPNEQHKGDMRSVVQKSFEQIKEKGFVQLFKSHRPEYADGDQQRDFIYVKDCSQVMMDLLKHRGINGLYNLGSGKARSWNDLVTSVFNSLKTPLDIRYIDMPQHLRGKYQYFTQAPMNKLKAVLTEFTPLSLEEGVSDYVSNYLEKDRLN